MNRAIEMYRYHEAAQLLWHFFWDEFCDWYIELKKLRFRENPASTPAGATCSPRSKARCACCIPRCRSSPKSSGSASRRPRHAPHFDLRCALIRNTAAGLTDSEAEREIGILQEIVTMARTLRTEAKLDPKQQLAGALYSRTAALDVAQRHAEAIQKLANVKLEFKAEAAPKAAAIRSTAEFDLVLEVPPAQRRPSASVMEKERDNS